MSVERSALNVERSAPRGAVFLSYAREDAAAAQRIAEALRSQGVEVWFDQSELRGGEAWDASIRKQIKECALFLPIVSAQTQARTEGYFRLEWRLAEQRTHLMGRSKAFLLPVCIDSTKEAEADVPESFLSVQWTRLAGGEAPPGFVQRVRSLLGIETVARAFQPVSSEPTGWKARATRKRAPWLVPTSVGLAAILVLALWQPWKKVGPEQAVAEAKPSAPATTPGTPSPAAAQPPPDFAPAKSVAVLPFENLSGDKDNEYFSDGISDELLNLLGKVPGLRVAGRTSAFSFKGQAITDREIAQRLGVAFLVSGTVQKSGTHVRITARLINAADGFQLWSDKITKELKDIFAAQDEIAGLIAQNLQLRLGSAPRTAKVVNPDAHRLVLEGRYFSSLRTTDDFARAEAVFVQAIAYDPEFASAHAGLAEVYVMRANYATQDGASERDVSADVKLARTEAERAIAIDPTMAEAYAALGYCHLLESRCEEAERQFGKALELNPNHAITYAWRAMMRLSQGRLDEALRDLEKTLERDPLWPVSISNYAETLLRAQRWGEALQVTERAMTLRQGIFIPSLGNRARILLALGRKDEAVATARVIRTHLHQNPRRGADDSAIWVLHQAGLEPEAAAYVEELLKTLPPLSQQRGFALGALGRFAAALPFLERTPPSVRRRLFWDSIWDPWRDDPRFQQLMEKLGCTEEYKLARATLARMLRENQMPAASGQKSAPSTAPPK